MGSVCHDFFLVLVYVCINYVCMCMYESHQVCNCSFAGGTDPRLSHWGTPGIYAAVRMQVPEDYSARSTEYFTTLTFNM